MVNKLKEWDLSNIVFTLTRGKFNGESRKKIIIPYVIFVVLCILGIILAVTMMSIEYVENKDSIASLVEAIISVVVGFSISPCVLYFLILRNEKIRKDVYLWLEDAVELNAYSKNIGTKYWLGIPSIRLQVEFDLNGVHYVRSTDNEVRGALDKGRPVGYFAHITKYADRKIKILYSPKYDQVMVLKK